MKPTPQQNLILDYDGNAVVIAAPGSGKTFVISHKIKTNLKQLLPHQGVVAISYTNKASNELKTRSLSNGEDSLSSFFGTIDRFYLSEIVIPFGKQVFGMPREEISIITKNILPSLKQNELEWANRSLSSINVTEPQLVILEELFLSGTILMETIGVLANYIFDHSLSCKKYLKARYTHLYIDEYQDSGEEQHHLFLKIVALGIKSIAVGDLNQSIYAFSGKDSKYLEDLTKTSGFKYFKLDKNHRCDPSIINYSNYLLNPKTELIKTAQNHLHYFQVNGNEKNVATFLDVIVDKVKKAYHIKSNSQIAILTRSRRTAELIDQALSTPHIYSESNELDIHLNVWSSIFSNLLFFVFDPGFRFTDVIEVFTNYDNFTRAEMMEIIALKRKLEGHRGNPLADVAALQDILIQLAQLIAPQSSSQDSVVLLKDVLTPPYNINSYLPSTERQIKIMTIHKSKGLEFDVVFHLDLHEWVFPQKSPGPDNDFDHPIYSDWIQDLNLHYVAITRARKMCMFVTSTKRTNNALVEKGGKDSEFLILNGIDKLRYVKKPK